MLVCARFELYIRLMAANRCVEGRSISVDVNNIYCPHMLAIGTVVMPNYLDLKTVFHCHIGVVSTRSKRVLKSY